MTAPAKQTIDEQIVIEEIKPYIGNSDRVNVKINGEWFWVPKAVARVIEAHKRVTEARGRPEPVAWLDAHKFKQLSNYKGELQFGVLTMLTAKQSFDDDAPLYGPDLLDYADRMAAERDEKIRVAERINKNYEETIQELLVGTRRRQTAERQLAELQKRHDALVKRLREPTDSMNKAGVAVGNEQASHAQHCDEVFTAMSAVALKGGE